MRRTLPLLALLVALCGTAPARCELPCGWFHDLLGGCSSLRQARQERQCWCPDDYCNKCMPSVRCNPKSCLRDDYCGKCPLVPPCPVPRGCMDDYRPRCCPVPERSCTEPWYKCIPLLNH